MQLDRSNLAILLKQLVRFVRRDLQRRYLGSMLGLAWAIIHPLTTVVVIWFVFDIGFKVKPVADGIPFFAWLVSGMVAWFYIAEAFNSSCFAVIEQGAIIKKMIIPVVMLPLVKVFSALAVHFAFLTLVLVVGLVFGFKLHASWINLLYFCFCAVSLAVAVSYIAASITVFLRDFSHIIAVITQLGFWGTPIFWDISILPEKYHWIISLNPVFYITEGYRQSILGLQTVEFDLAWTGYFWLFTIILFALGTLTYSKLKSHFGEIL